MVAHPHDHFYRTYQSLSINAEAFVLRAGEAWGLLVSHKTQQARDLTWLARQP